MSDINHHPSAALDSGNRPPEESVYDTDYETGQDNVAVMGFDLHNPVFFISAAAIISFIVGTLLFPQQAASWMNGAKDWTVTNFDWFFVIATNIVLIFLSLIHI